jgi:N-acetylmuramoyl-L-alanine amidase
MHFFRLPPRQSLRVTPCVGAALIALLSWLATTDAQARNRGPQRTVPIDMVVIHSTGGPLCDVATQKVVWVKGGELRENLRVIESHPVLGIHHMIDRDGSVHASVPEAEVAHHVKTHSQRSIAIELINDGDGVEPFSQAQLEATMALLKQIVARHGIKRKGVVRHSDVDRSTMPCDPSQRRKVDPGPLYPHERVLDLVFSPSLPTPSR